jgi:hypothetical protein
MIIVEFGPDVMHGLIGALQQLGNSSPKRLCG